MNDFTHPLDVQYFQKLNDNKALKLVMGALSKAHAITNAFAEIPDRNLIVNATTFPRLNKMYRLARERLEISTACDVFCNMDFGRNVRVIGTDDNCAIVIDSSCAEDFSDEHLLATFGIALGHIKMRHVTYMTSLELIDGLGIFVPKIAKDAAKSMLLDWLITAEYTADRAGAIAAGSIRAVIEHHLLASGFETIEQCAGYDLNTRIDLPQGLNGFDRAAKIVMIETLRDFPMPFVIPRIKELVEWSTSMECKRDFPSLHVKSNSTIQSWQQKVYPAIGR